MNNLPSVKRNFILNTVLAVSNFLFPLLIFPYVSRVLLPAGTGKAAMAASVISYFNILAQLGVPVYGIRACAVVRDDREKLSQTVKELLVLNLITTVLSYVFLLLSILCIPQLRQEKELYIIMSLSIGFNTAGMEWLYKGLEQYDYITIRSIVFKGIALILVFLLVHSEQHYILYGALTIFAGSASNILNLINSRKYVSIIKKAHCNWRRHRKPAIIFFAMVCATTIYTNLDNVMLGFMQDEQAVGYYHASIRIRTVILSLITSLGTVMLPRASYYVEHNMLDRFHQAMDNAMHFVVLLSVPLIGFVILFAPNCIFFLAGKAYAPSIISLRIVIPTIFFVGITNIAGFQVLIPTGRERTVFHSVLLGALVDCIINFMLIPRFSIVGAAIGTLAAEIAVLIYQAVSLYPEFLKTMKKIPFLKIAACTIAAVLSCMWLTKTEMADFYILLWGGILYLSVYFIALLLLKEQMILDAFHGLKTRKHSI